jgi:UDP-glucose 4-epimerase
VNKKTAVITGGAGFIGSHLAEALANRNYQIVILDDLSTGKMASIDSILAKSDVKFVPGSVTDLALLNKLFQNMDYVFHLAAITSVPRSVEAPLASHEVNITGTLNVLMAAKASKVRKLVYASSSSVYGDTPTLPKNEDMFPNPQSPYAVAKLCGEYYCRVFLQVYSLNTASLRYFNVYGPRQDPNSQYAAVIPAFIKRLSEGRSPIIFGDGEQTRDFTFVKDAVEASIMTAESDATGVFNVGTGHRTSINELAKLVATIMGSGVTAIHEKARTGDVKHSQANISKAREIGYNPRYSLEEGLKETIKGWQQ